MKILAWLVVNVLALWAAIWLVPGISLEGADLSEYLLQLVMVGGILGLISSIVKPVLKAVSFPIVVLSLGFFLLVLNALLLMLTAWIAGRVDLQFTVDGFWPALLGGIVVSIASVILDSVVPDGDDD